MIDPIASLAFSLPVSVTIALSLPVFFSFTIWNAAYP